MSVRKFSEKEIKYCEERKHLYDKYVRNSVCFITKSDLSKVLGLSMSDIYADTSYLSQKYGYIFIHRNTLSYDNIKSILGFEINDNGDLIDIDTSEIWIKSEKYNKSNSVVDKELDEEKKKRLLASLEEHKSLYYDILENYGYMPPISTVSKMLEIPSEVVSAELNELCIKVAGHYEYSILKEQQKIQEKALQNLEFFKENFFDIDIPMDMTKMCVKLGLSESTVMKQIDFLREMGYSEKVKREKEEIRRPKKMDLTEGRHLYYLENFFNASGENVKSPKEMAEELGLHPMTITNDLKYLREKYGYVKDYKNIKRGSVRGKKLFINGVEYKDRYEFIDLNYFNSFFPMKPMEMLEMLQITERALYGTLNKMKKNGYSKLELVVGEDGLIRGTKYESRLKNYILYFKKYKSVDSLSTLASVLCLPNTTVKDDFNGHNLYSLFEVKTGKHKNNDELKNRLLMYENYFNETLNPVTTITELSEVLKIRRQTVLFDFSVNNLYEKYGVEVVYTSKEIEDEGN